MIMKKNENEAIELAKKVAATEFNCVDKCEYYEKGCCFERVQYDAGTQDYCILEKETINEYLDNMKMYVVIMTNKDNKSYVKGVYTDRKFAEYVGLAEIEYSSREYTSIIEEFELNKEMEYLKIWENNINESE